MRKRTIVAFEKGTMRPTNQTITKWTLEPGRFVARGDSSAPSVQTTKSARAIFCSTGHWAARRCWICTGVQPRASRRSRWAEAEQAAQMVLSKCDSALVSKSNGITTTASVRFSGARRRSRLHCVSTRPAALARHARFRLARASVRGCAGAGCLQAFCGRRDREK